MPRPQAVSLLSAPLKAVNDLLTTKAGKKRPDRQVLLCSYLAGLEELLGLLGLEVQDTAAVLRELGQLALVRSGIDEEFIQGKIRERAEARAAKDFARADQVRVELNAKGISLLDGPQGTTWRPAPLLE